MLGDETKKTMVDIDAIDPDECALVVIDGAGRPHGHASGTRPEARDREHGAAGRRRPHARCAGGVRERRAPSRPRPRIGPVGRARAIAGTPEAQTSPLLDPQEGDFTVEKRRYSAFFQTGLRLLLDELGVTTLVCVGMDTNICVRHTVADAYFNNFDIVVVSDATATFLVGDQGGACLHGDVLRGRRRDHRRGADPLRTLGGTMASMEAVLSIAGSDSAAGRASRPTSRRSRRWACSPKRP